MSNLYRIHSISFTVFTPRTLLYTYRSGHPHGKCYWSNGWPSAKDENIPPRDYSTATTSPWHACMLPLCRGGKTQSKVEERDSNLPRESHVQTVGSSLHRLFTKKRHKLFLSTHAPRKWHLWTPDPFPNACNLCMFLFSFCTNTLHLHLRRHDQSQQRHASVQTVSHL